MAGAHEPRGKVRLHHWLIGGLAQVFFVWAVICTCGLLPWQALDSIHTGHARDLVLLLPLIPGLAFVSFWQLRLRPKVYGGERGLDLVWVWGQKRHVPWEDVRDVQEVSSAWNTSTRFRVGLSHGSISFYARADFPERIHRLKLTRPTR